MRPFASVPGLATLAWAVALVCAVGPAAHAADPARAPAPGVAPEAARAGRPPRDLLLSHAATDEAALVLGRAAMERSLGSPSGVVAALEGLDYATEPAFADADRAAFLLGEAYLRLGARARFLTLARQVATWSRASVYTRWIAFRRAQVETERTDPPAGRDGSGTASSVAATGSAAADALATGVLLRDGNRAAALALISAIEARGHGSPLVTYLKARALDAGGDASEDARGAWLSLAGTDTTSRLGRHLAGAARVRLATESLRRGEDPRTWLAHVPSGSPYASRARHMMGLASIERGDTAQGLRMLGTLAGDDSSYSARREVWLALAGASLDRGDWPGAHRLYREIDRDWTAHRDLLGRLAASGDTDSLWRSWEEHSPLSSALMLDAAPASRLADALEKASVDLRARPDVELPELDAPALPEDSPYRIPPPPPGTWLAVTDARRDMHENAAALTRTRWEQAREDERLGSRRRYLAVGLGRARTQADSLAACASLLDSLRATLEALDARLRAVRDQATRRILRRTMAVLEECAGNLLWMEAMHHYHLAGPERERATAPPDGYPGPDSVLAGEQALARAVDALARRVVAEAPGLIARSYDQAWRPGIIERAAVQDSVAHDAWAWARRLATAIDSSIAAASSSEELRRLGARADSLAGASASLAATWARLRADGAREAIDAALAALDGEREGIDYGLAASAYGLGVRLGEPAVADPRTGARAGRSTAAGDATDSTALDPLDEADAARWRGEAVTLHRTFLERHPGSPARGETRFRLADMLLVEARRTFREQMAAYVRDQSQGGTAQVPLPVLSHAEPLALYRAILAEDPQFEHRDAVLFNAGMILADGADPEAERMFGRLVTHHPQSPYGQEATLRMGDMRFNEKRYAESIEFYRRAVAGADAGLTAIALYKTGWANYNQDHFAEAAVAFGAVLDLYASERRPEIEADVAGEAETYLVHSLAGAGGAAAFDAHFARAGRKPYEQRVLMSLGQHFRRFGLYAQAVAVDELCIDRYPNTADALISAQRLIDTHQRSRQPDRARQARLSFSARFAPGGAWARAQDSDSLRSAGAEFARTSLRSVAQEYHQRARTSRAPADWRAAHDLYRQVLTTWPDDPEAPALALMAGEAATQLGDYPTALAHYQAAARAGDDSVAARAMWQRVAVSDAWYESTRGSGKTRAATGRDSLARAVLQGADALLERFPGHPQSADLMWRQGNLAFAHGWLEESAGHFGRLASDHPADARAPRAAILRADAWFRLGRYDAAGPAYEQALAAARATQADSLARRAAQAIPVAYYRLAESVVAEDSTRFERHGELFQQVASRWPHYPYAPLAQYRAGLAWSRAGKADRAVRAMNAVIDSFPSSEYVRDAHLEIARIWEADGDQEKSAAAYARFAERHPKDPGAADAWLKSGDLYAAAGKDDEALRIRLAYIRRYPGDVETAMDVYEGLAMKDLKSIGPDHPISRLLAAPVTAAGNGAAARKGGAAKGAPAPAPSHLAEYLRRAKANPKLASREIMAQVSYWQAEEARPAYEALRLRLPLPTSIAAKQKRLDHLMGLYRTSVEQGVPEWAHAATFRIGEALASFGDALQASERPRDLAGDALDAYEAVLFEKAGEFGERGENVWSELLRQRRADAKDDPWLARAQAALWQRMGDRFAYRPETDYPLVGGKAAEKRELVEEPPAVKGSGRSAGGDSASGDEQPKARKSEENPR